eukprot:6085947-Pleurochrysis_carterae.AAC.2
MDGVEQKFTIRKPVSRKRKTVGYDAQCQAASELSALRKDFAAVKAELKKPKGRFALDLAAGIRDGDRIKARGEEADASVYVELARVKEELVLARRAFNHQSHYEKLSRDVSSLEGDVSVRDKQIKVLEQRLLTYEKNDALGKRRLANVSIIVESRAAELRA